MTSSPVSIYAEFSTNTNLATFLPVGENVDCLHHGSNVVPMAIMDSAETWTANGQIDEDSLDEARVRVNYNSDGCSSAF